MNKSLWLAALVPSASLSAAQTVVAEDMIGMNMEMKPATCHADKAFADSMKSMMTSMRVKPTGNPDKDFVVMMIPHHQGTIDIAKVELQSGTDRGLRQLATDIVGSQEKEIAQMNAWLANHGKQSMRAFRNGCARALSLPRPRLVL